MIQAEKVPPSFTRRLAATLAARAVAPVVTVTLPDATNVSGAASKDNAGTVTVVSEVGTVPVVALPSFELFASIHE